MSVRNKEQTKRLLKAGSKSTYEIINGDAKFKSDCLGAESKYIILLGGGDFNVCP